MYSSTIYDKGKIDRWMVAFYLFFVVAGWLNIYAASYDLENAVNIFDLSGRAGMQLIWIGTSLLVAFAIMKIDTSFFDTFALLFYAIGIILLIVTVAIAPDIKGSRSWLVLGPVSIQPAEFMKFIIALALAKIMNIHGFKLMETKNLLLVSAIILLPMLIVIFQSETGTALVYLSFVIMLYREGLPGGFIFTGLAMIVYFVVGIKFSEEQIGIFSRGEVYTIVIILIFTAGMVWSYVKRMNVLLYILGISATIFLGSYLLSLFNWIEVDYGISAIISLSLVVLYLLFLSLRYWKIIYLLMALFAIGSFVFLESVEYVFEDVLQPHQQMRIKVTLGMEEDLLGSGYHIGQSKIAIGSGALFGKGYLNGTQTKLKYVPEQDTDFIFCTIGEEQGFIGSSVLLLLFLIFILRLIFMAERQKTTFGRVYGYAVAGVFIFHLIVNIGMVLGLTPVIGIPLPFFSYGGSSLWGFTILLFIFLRIDKSRKRI
ncbi:MAG: rod shape-determining protein RodA [Dysgonamonadaceae bacterium]|nr:rod shape-determining protein RodA [Dysgonamonadaceae bacterium]MDD3356398.1 rod shape-determining protein RodA [Dysgonamonadaceae bacterium]MDD3727802.1 rod shape-determining protein RodA [Dysgonamonadaceae bacterium]MDD4246069.1 rod shape-determining protein RodA [Dysgonamonadaceae bacterium]MDD4605612.1 rod shape-determining protein RodA [Dysgonamonadaceae bacterium]